MRSGIIIEITKISPKKPNSGNRRILKVKDKENKIRRVYIKGEYREEIHTYGKVYFVNNARRDLPGIKYSLVYNRGDIKSIYRRSSRSKYGGCKDIKGYNKKIYCSCLYCGFK